MMGGVTVRCVLPQCKIILPIPLTPLELKISQLSLKKKKKEIGGRIPHDKDDLRNPYKVYLNDKERKILLA